MSGTKLRNFLYCTLPRVPSWTGALPRMKASKGTIASTAQTQHPPLLGPAFSPGLDPTLCEPGHAELLKTLVLHVPRPLSDPTPDHHLPRSGKLVRSFPPSSNHVFQLSYPTLN